MFCPSINRHNKKKIYTYFVLASNRYNNKKNIYTYIYILSTSTKFT